MQSLFLSAVYFSLILMGCVAAFGAALGFVWVDIVKPQMLAYSIIAGWPLSFITALIMLTLFFVKDRKSPPKFTLTLLLISVFLVWVTITTAMSPIPYHPWDKWDWVSKVLIFAVLMPYIFRSRVQIEAFILVFIFAASTMFFSAGAKTLLGGGGYGVLSVMGQNNTGLAESSTLAVVCVALIPLMHYCMRHTLLFPKNKYTVCLFLGLMVMALATVVGTTARAGLIALALLYVLLFMQSKKKIWFIGAAFAGLIVLMNMDLAHTPWGSRMSTIETYNQDSSALGRLAVWKWTLEFVAENPLGGGFDAYALNGISAVTPEGEIQYYPEGMLKGKAFHSIYFEVLGEQGIVGFVMYMAIILITLFNLRKLKRKWKEHDGMKWISALASALSIAILVFMAGGAFVGIAYQPFIFYMFSLTVALEQYSLRVDQAEKKKNSFLITSPAGATLVN